MVADGPKQASTKQSLSREDKTAECASSENTNAMPISKTKPPSMIVQTNRPEERAFGR